MNLKVGQILYWGEGSSYYAEFLYKIDLKARYTHTKGVFTDGDVVETLGSARSMYTLITDIFV